MRYDPHCEDAWKDGFKEGMDSTADSKGWTVIGLMAAGLSGFLVGAIVGIVIMVFR